MKRAIWFLTLSIAVQIGYAQDVQFFSGTWEEANALAEKENKGILVDAYTDWCGPCKQMDKVMFHNNLEVAEQINTHFIAYKVDCERDFGLVFSRKFKVSGYPSLLFFNSKGQLIDRMLGFNADQKEFMADIQSVVDMDQEDAYGYDAKNLQPDWPDFYAQAFRNANDTTWKFPKEADPNAFLDTQTNLTDEVCWAVMTRFGLNEKYNTYFRAHYDAYHALYRKEAETKIQNLLFDDVSKAAKANDDASFQMTVASIDKYFPGDPEELAFYMEQYYFRTTADWKGFANAFDDRIQSKGDAVSLGEINSIAWTLFEKSEDRAVLKKALGWFRPYLSDMDDYYAMDTYAALLFKLDLYDDAEGWAIKAIEAGRADEMDVSGTEELLEKIRMKNR